MAEASSDEFSIENILELKEEKPSESSSSGEAANKPNTMPASEGTIKQSVCFIYVYFNLLDEASIASKLDESSSSGEASNKPNTTSAYEGTIKQSVCFIYMYFNLLDEASSEQASERLRVKLTSGQLSFLENIFAVYPYPDINAYRLW